MTATTSNMSHEFGKHRIDLLSTASPTLVAKRQRHLLRSHDDDDNDMTDILKCDQLSSDSQSAANMENSERSLPSEPRVVYMCPEVSCNVFFITVQELAAHMSEKEHGHCPLDPQKGVIKNSTLTDCAICSDDKELAQLPVASQLSFHEQHSPEYRLQLGGYTTIVMLRRRGTFSCPNEACGRAYVSPTTLLYHLQSGILGCGALEDLVVRVNLFYLQMLGITADHGQAEKQQLLDMVEQELQAQECGHQRQTQHSSRSIEDNPMDEDIGSNDSSGSLQEECSATISKNTEVWITTLPTLDETTPVPDKHPGDVTCTTPTNVERDICVLSEEHCSQPPGEPLEWPHSSLVDDRPILLSCEVDCEETEDSAVSYIVDRHKGKSGTFETFGRTIQPFECTVDGRNESFITKTELDCHLQSRDHDIQLLDCVTPGEITREPPITAHVSQDGDRRQDSQNLIQKDTGNIQPIQVNDIQTNTKVENTTPTSVVMELDSRDEAEESDVNRHLPTNGQEGDRNSVGPRKPAKNLYTCPGKGCKATFNTQNRLAHHLEFRKECGIQAKAQDQKAWLQQRTNREGNGVGPRATIKLPAGKTYVVYARTVVHAPPAYLSELPHSNPKTSTVTWFDCPFQSCERSFTTRGGLKYHLVNSTHTTEDSPTNNTATEQEFAPPSRLGVEEVNISNEGNCDDNFESDPQDDRNTEEEANDTNFSGDSSDHIPRYPMDVQAVFTSRRNTRIQRKYRRKHALFVCHHCGNGFVSSIRLKHHLVNMHKMVYSNGQWRQAGDLVVVNREESSTPNSINRTVPVLEKDVDSAALSITVNTHYLCPVASCRLLFSKIEACLSHISQSHNPNAIDPELQGSHPFVSAWPKSRTPGSCPTCLLHKKSTLCDQLEIQVHHRRHLPVCQIPVKQHWSYSITLLRYESAFQCPGCNYKQASSTAMRTHMCYRKQHKRYRLPANYTAACMDALIELHTANMEMESWRRLERNHDEILDQQSNDQNQNQAQRPILQPLVVDEAYATSESSTLSSPVLHDDSSGSEDNNDNNGTIEDIVDSVELYGHGFRKVDEASTTQKDQSHSLNTTLQSWDHHHKFLCPEASCRLTLPSLEECLSHIVQTHDPEAIDLELQATHPYMQQWPKSDKAKNCPVCSLRELMSGQKRGLVHKRHSPVCRIPVMDQSITLLRYQSKFQCPGCEFAHNDGRKFHLHLNKNSGCGQGISVLQKLISGLSFADIQQELEDSAQQLKHELEDDVQQPAQEEGQHGHDIFPQPCLQDELCLAEPSPVVEEPHQSQLPPASPVAETEAAVVEHLPSTSHPSANHIDTGLNVDRLEHDPGENVREISTSEDADQGGDGDVEGDEDSDGEELPPPSPIQSCSEMAIDYDQVNAVVDLSVPFVSLGEVRSFVMLCQQVRAKCEIMTLGNFTLSAEGPFLECMLRSFPEFTGVGSLTRVTRRQRKDGEITLKAVFGPGIIENALNITTSAMVSMMVKDVLAFQQAIGEFREQIEDMDTVICTFQGIRFDAVVIQGITPALIDWIGEI